MTGRHDQEVAANLERARESIQAARELARADHFDFAASRAYYAAFYAARAALLFEGVEYGRHSGVIAAIHQRFVKTGKLEQKLGKHLNWLFELRGVGDYGESRHVPKADAERAIEAAEEFVDGVMQMLGRASG